MSQNTGLQTLNCKNNNLESDALNILFGTLHSNKVMDRFWGTEAQKKIHTSENPGTESCDQSIAINKGWEVITTGK